MMRHASLSYRRIFSAVLLSAALLAAGLVTARAAAPMAKAPAPGFYRMSLGQFEVTALDDGTMGMDVGLLRNVADKKLRSLLALMFVEPAGLQAGTNAYAVNTGSQLVLVDAGAGTAFGPALGRLAANLKASGYEPSQVDAVLVTHLHGDHVGGLIEADGKAAFPNAVVYVAKADSDHWLSKEIMEQAPAAAKPFFKMAQDAAAPYIAAGRWKTFCDGDNPVPGITAKLLAGHTPGHAAFEIVSDGQKLLVIGDTVHVMAAQFARPEIAIVYDTDQKQAVATRQALFLKVADDRTLVAGMHIPFPGIGRVRADGRSTYTWVPAAFSSAQQGGGEKAAR